MSTQKLNKLFKTMAAILLVMLTAVVTSAAPCRGPMPRCGVGFHAACINGYWRCVH